MGVVSSDILLSLWEDVLYLPKCKEIVFLIYVRKKEGGCRIIVHRVKCVRNRYCREIFRLRRGKHLICRENTVCHSTDRLCLHSHVKGKGAYSVVPVSLKFGTEEVLDELYIIYFKHFENTLLSFHFTLLNYMSKKLRDLFPIHKFLRLKERWRWILAQNIA